MAKNAKRREWTKDDVRELKTLARQKTPVAKIAKSLKRTPGATQQKAFSLLVRHWTRAGLRLQAHFDLTRAMRDASENSI